jgi:hypothetical protein
VITDPLFYLLAVVAVVLQGLSKGRFLGLGLMSLPLKALALVGYRPAAACRENVIHASIFSGR